MQMFLHCPFHICRRSLEKAHRSVGSVLMGTIRQKPWPRTLRRAASSSLSLLHGRPTSLSPRECLPALSVRFWMLSLFHNRQAVLTKAQPTIAIDQLSATKPAGNSLLLTMKPSDQAPVLFGSEYSKKLEKLFYLFRSTTTDMCDPFRTQVLNVSLSANTNGPWEVLCFN